jgi:hypothetical protein
MCFFNCNKSRKNAVQTTEEAIILNGEQLAKLYCATCHGFPKAEFLPKKYWEEVLPIMGMHYRKLKEGKIFSDFTNEVAKERLKASGLFPEEDVLNDQQWGAIRKYYALNAPEELPEVEQPVFDYNLPQFTKVVLPWKSTGEGLTYLNFYQGNYEIGFNTEKEFGYIKLDKEGKQITKQELSYPLVDVLKNGKSELLLIMGRMANVDEPTGEIVVNAEGKLHKFIDKLERPVDFILEDFDNDGVVDILVAEFGKYLGGINIYSRLKTLNKTNIHDKSGAVKFVVKDVNKDGLKDFYVLIAQEDESVYLFMNEGDLKFNEKRLLQLPPYYGTTHFELLDMDGDGDDDIICSSGDSDDFVSVLKPMHGVRIFENDGDSNFTQVWFHNQEGAYGTAVADYDNDGDIDIASIGYYASYRNKDQEGFLYFENKSSVDQPWQFKTYSPLGNEHNCFMLIKAKDIDNDGDLDILLGSNSGIFGDNNKALKSEQWKKNGGVLTILRNNQKK